MLWLADEKIPGHAIEFLRQCGEDVVVVVEVDPGIPDRKVIDLAREQHRILLTFDRDHGDLVFNRKVRPPHAIVYFRFYPPDPETLERTLTGLIDLGEKSLDGRFTVFSSGGMRQRPLLFVS